MSGREVVAWVMVGTFGLILVVLVACVARMLIEMFRGW